MEISCYNYDQLEFVSSKTALFQEPENHLIHFENVLLTEPK